MSGYRETYGALEHAMAASMRARSMIEAHEHELACVRDDRIARIAGGLTGVLGAVLWPIPFFVYEDRHRPDFFLGLSSLPTYWLWGTVAASLVVWRVTRAVLGHVKRPILGHGARTRERPGTAASNPWLALSQALRSLETRSLEFPLVAATLLGPLFLQSLVAMAVNAVWPGEGFGSADFSGWIALSGVVVPHAHLALAVHAVRFVRRLGRTGDLTDDAVRRAWVRGLGVAVLCAAVPGILLLAIPPILAAVTGLVLVPLIYRLAVRAHRQEHVVLDLLDRFVGREVAGMRIDVAELEAARDLLRRVEDPSKEPVAAEGSYARGSR